MAERALSMLPNMPTGQTLHLPSEPDSDARSRVSSVQVYQNRKGSRESVVGLVRSEAADLLQQAPRTTDESGKTPGLGLHRIEAWEARGLTSQSESRSHAGAAASGASARTLVEAAGSGQPAVPPALRDGAAVARGAHNAQVVGSNPALATRDARHGDVASLEKLAALADDQKSSRQAPPRCSFFSSKNTEPLTFADQQRAEAHRVARNNGISLALCFAVLLIALASCVVCNGRSNDSFRPQELR